MAYNKAPSDHSEFGGGPGLVDPELRKDRALEPRDQLLEIYATDPGAPEGTRDWDPATASLTDRERLGSQWPDAKTARGTT